MKPDASLTPIVLLPGIREDVRQLAPPGSLRIAQNVRFGADRIFPRPPAPAIVPTVAQPGVNPAAPIITGSEKPNLVARLGDKNLLGVDGMLFAQDELAGVFNFQGIYSSCTPLGKTAGFSCTTTLGSVGLTKTSGVAVNSDGYLLKASVVAVSPSAIVTIETPEGVRIAQKFLGGGVVTKVVCVAQGATLVLVFQRGVDIIAQPFTVTAGVVATPGETTLITMANAANYWDASNYSSAFWVLATQQNVGGNIVLQAWNVTTKSIAVDGAQVTGAVSAVSIWGDPATGRAFVGWAVIATGVTNYSVWTINAGVWANLVGTTAIGGAGVVGRSPPLFGPGVSSRGAFWVIPYSRDGVAPYERSATYGWLATNGTYIAITNVAMHVYPISKPDSKCRVWCMTQNEATNWRTQRHVLLRFRPASINGGVIERGTIDLTTEETPAPLAPATSLPSRKRDYFHAIAEGATAHHFPLPFVQRQAPGAQDGVSVDYVKYTPFSLRPHRSTQDFGAFAVFTGQLTAAHGSGTGADIGAAVDPSTCQGNYEIGFALRPAVVSAAQSAGGNLTAAGVYSWVFVFEWVDPLGQRHRSAPSAPFSQTMAPGNQQVAFVVTGMGEWEQRAIVPMQPTLVAYRTVAGGSVYYRESTPAGGLGAVATTIAYTSGANATETDALVSTSEIVYTDGANAGVIENAMPPSCAFVCRSEERLFIAGGFDRRQVVASKIIVPYEPVQFSASPVFRVVLPEDCTGLAFSDGAVIAFTRRGVYAITGDGPADDGSGGLFSAPRAISRDIGCVDYRSVLETSAGIFFRGERGFYLLPRGLGVPQFIGMPVEITCAAYPYCIGAAYFANGQNRNVRFLVSTNEHTAGATNVLVYDLELNAWSLDVYGFAVLEIGTWNPVAGRIAGVAMATADLSFSTFCGYLEQDTGVAGRDGLTQNYAILWETNEIRPWGVAGFGKLGAVALVTSQYTGSQPITITLGCDRDQPGAESAVRSWTPALPLRAYAQVIPQSGKFSSFYFRASYISDASATFLNFHALQLESEPLGERRFADTERTG